MINAVFDKNGERIIQIIRSIRKPAGDKFGPMEVQSNRDEFITAYHDGLKKLHLSLVGEIMIYEKTKELFLKDKAKDPENRNVRIALSTLDEILLTWRRANDCIAWIILGLDRNTVRRLCLHNTKGYLKDQNPGHALEFLIN